MRFSVPRDVLQPVPQVDPHAVHAVLALLDEAVEEEDAHEEAVADAEQDEAGERGVEQLQPPLKMKEI